MIDTKQGAKYILEEYANCYSDVDVEELAKSLDEIKAEAIKEYEKKVIEKTLAMVYSCDLLSTEDYIECIQSIGKEMVGECND